jgi:hypothetical protein
MKRDFCMEKKQDKSNKSFYFMRKKKNTYVYVTEYTKIYLAYP